MADDHDRGFKKILQIVLIAAGLLLGLLLASGILVNGVVVESMRLD
ncbi:MAG: hypothetical protein ABL925_17470 [Methylococcales bacterium]